MSFEIRETEILPPSLPKPRTIVIGGREVGTVELKQYGRGVLWHAAIKVHSIPGETIFVTRWLLLIQGHGPTPEQAVDAAIAAARRERDDFAARLAWVEEQVGTSRMDLAAIERRALSGEHPNEAAALDRLADDIDRPTLRPRGEYPASAFPNDPDYDPV